MITCPNCGRENADEVRLCSFCDHELRPPESINCPSCGRLNAADNEVCPHCGARLTGDAPEVETGGLADDPWSLEGFREEIAGEMQDQGAGAEAAPPAEPEQVPDLLADLPSAAPSDEETVPAGVGRDDALAALDLGPDEPATSDEPTLPSGEDVLDLLGGLADEPTPEQPAEDRPDWLTEDLLPGDEPVEAATDAPAGDMPDWIAERAPSEEAAPASPDDDLPDWMHGDAPEPVAAEPGELPDWLAGDQPASEAGDLPPDTLDWMRDEAPAAPPELEPADTAMDALDSFRMESGAEPPEDQPEAPSVPEEPQPEPLEDPFALLDAEEDAAPPQPASEAEAEPEPEREGLDWLTDDILGPATPITPAQPEVVSDDWLDQALGAPPDIEDSDLGEMEPLAPEPQDAETVSADWLDQTLGAPPAEAEEEPAAEQPDWLAGDTAPAASEDDMPDWLHQASTHMQTGTLQPLMEDEGSGAPPETPEPASPLPADSDWQVSDDDDMPDWLRTATTKARTGELPPLPSVPGVEDTVDAAPPDAEPLEPAVPDVFAGEEPAEAAPAAGLDDEPDWLLGLSQETQPPVEEEQPTPTEAAPAEADVGEEGMPDWLRAMSPESVEAVETPLPAVDEALAESSLFEGNLFDWLDEETNLLDEALEPEVIEDEPGEEEIEPPEGLPGEGEPTAPLTEPIDLEEGELPDWLRDLRPAEAEQAIAEASAPTAQHARPLEHPTPELEMLRAASIPGVLDSEFDTREENVGPLKGVVGVVAASPLFATLQHAVTGPAQAAVEVDSAQVALLEEIVRPEAEGVRPDQAERFVLPVARILMTLLLFAAVALPIAGGFTPFPAPDVIDVPAADAARAIASLDAAPQVLVAFEYDPAQVGEMEAGAGALIQALMSRGATLYVVSTQPTGPALAQSTLETLAGQNNYEYGEGYFNLGYVSGDAAGVRGLVTGVTPGTVSPLAFDYQGEPTEFGGSRLNDLDVGMIVVIAGRPESVRMWVEQAGTPSGIPVVAAVSAGAEPFALPYYHQGRQIEGIVSGFAGAVSFTLATQTAGLPPALEARWNAQVAGTLFVALAILVGLVVQLSARATRPQERP